MGYINIFIYDPSCRDTDYETIMKRTFEKKDYGKVLSLKRKHMWDKALVYAFEKKKSSKKKHKFPMFTTQVVKRTAADPMFALLSNYNPEGDVSENKSEGTLYSDEFTLEPTTQLPEVKLEPDDFGHVYYMLENDGDNELEQSGDNMLVVGNDVKVNDVDANEELEAQHFNYMMGVDDMPVDDNGPNMTVNYNGPNTTGDYNVHNITVDDNGHNMTGDDINIVQLDDMPADHMAGGKHKKRTIKKNHKTRTIRKHKKRTTRRHKKSKKRTIRRHKKRITRKR